MERKKPVPREFYRHFKDKLYQIIAVAEHSETGEELVIYQALYGTYGIYARPLIMFMSEVDHDKYPDVKQKYRFEKVVLEEEHNQLEEKQECTDAEEDTEEIEKPNSDLLDFLDADTFEKKRQILAGMKNRVTDRLIDDMAASLDVTIDDGDLEDRYRSLMVCVDTMERFEVSRLR